MEFNYFLPVNIVFGSGKVLETGELTRPYGKKALIVTGKSSAKKSGLYDKVNDSLKAAGLETVLFDKVSQNPLTTTAQEGADFAKANGCDVVVAIGGGSIMDCAKAIAFLSKNDGDINDYIYNRLRSDDALPLVLIPTTCGTGSEGNGFAVLTNPDNGDKKSLRCAILDVYASILWHNASNVTDASTFFGIVIIHSGSTMDTLATMALQRNWKQKTVGKYHNGKYNRRYGNQHSRSNPRTWNGTSSKRTEKHRTRPGTCSLNTSSH